jgi:hypothetical protein
MSDFARSLYMEQTQPPSSEQEELSRPSGLRRQRSTRRSSAYRFGGGRRSAESNTNDGEGIAAAAAAVQRAFDNLSDDGEGSRGNAGHGHELDTEIISDNDEVLEQYRIMAHLEASLRVKDKIGFDMTEYEERRQIQKKPAKGNYSTGRLQQLQQEFPEPRVVEFSYSNAPEEPPFPSLPAHDRRQFLVDLQTPPIPELCPGIVLKGSTAAASSEQPEGEHVVRCLGCRSPLRVHLLASLVRCHECATVSPATSNRR